MRNRTRQAVVAASISALVAVAAVTQAPLVAEESESSESLLRRVVAQTTREGVAVRATRELRAGTVSGKHTGWMTVDTSVSPTGQFTWNIVTEGGSDRTREKVFRALLQSEAEACRAGARDGAALTPANYEFTPLGAPQPGQVQFRVTPKRADSRLIDGTLTVSADGYPLRLEGKLAKSPSFWVKSVKVVREYGRFAGVALPISMESTADLKMIGKSTFTMRYHYHEVNGRPLARAATTAEP